MSRPPQRRAPPARQRGIALLVAILLVALAAVIAAALAYDNAVTERQTIATLDYNQALLVTEGTEAFAAYGLQQTFRAQPSLTDVAQPWADPIGPLTVSPGVTLEAHLTDLQGRFNLNNLIASNGITVNAQQLLAFRRLLTLVGLSPNWADDWVNWIDKSPTPAIPGAPADAAYAQMDPPYQTPALPVTSASELLALPDFGRARFERIAPYVTALPVGTPLNVCTASPYVLDAYLGHTQFSANPTQFAKDRLAAGGCFPTISEFETAYSNTLPATANAAGAGAGAPQTDFQQLFSQSSQWFRLTSRVSSGATRFIFYTVLYRDANGMVTPILLSDTPN
jgi:general secretion pathway protein K